MPRHVPHSSASRTWTLALTLGVAAAGCSSENSPATVTATGGTGGSTPGAGGASISGGRSGATATGGTLGLPGNTGGTSGRAGGTTGGVAATGGSTTSGGTASTTGGRSPGAGGATGGAPEPAGGSAGEARAGEGGADDGSSGDGGSAGEATGGAGPSGGAPSSGGSGGGTGGMGGTAKTSCPNPTDGGVLDATVIVAKNQTYDGKCQRFRAGSALGDGSQSESQQPMFRLEDGARLINVVLGNPAADGIHTYGDVTLENITWEDIGEDALTIKESGTVVLNGGSARNGDDKVFQVNAASTFRVSNFTASDAGKFIRQNGGTTFKVDVFIDACDISNMDESIFRTDSSSSTVTMTNTRYSDIGDELFMGVSPANITQSNNTEY